MRFLHRLYCGKRSKLFIKYLVRPVRPVRLGGSLFMDAHRHRIAGQSWQLLMAFIVVALITPLFAAPLFTAAATTHDSTPVYSGYGHTYPQVTILRAGTEITLVARNTIGNWLYITWDDAGAIKDGWVMIGYLNLPQDFKLSDLAVIAALPDADLTQIPDETLNALYSVPILPTIQPEMCTRYQASIAAGRNADVISKVGDSNSATRVYLTPIGEGNYDLGPYDFLQETVDTFGASFAIQSVATRVGMNALSVFDPMWSNRQACEPGETPLDCEYRRTQPAIALIMFGANDVKVLNSEGYEAQLRLIIQTTLDAQILPVLMTFSTNPEVENYFQTLRFNQIVIDLAAEYTIPVVNFWSAARALYRGGVGDDDVHLTQPGGSFTIGYNESFYGLPLHNLLVLHILNSLQHTCLTETPVHDEGNS